MQIAERHVSRAPTLRARSWLGCLVLAAAAIGPTAACPSALAAPPRRTVEVLTIDGSPVSGPFAGVTAAGVRIDGHDAPIPLDGVRELRFQPDPVPASRSAGVALRVFLRGGEIVVGRLVSGSDGDLEIEPTGLPTIKISFDWMRRIESDKIDPKLRLDPEPGRLLAPRNGMDVAYARSGDAFPGTLLAADKNGVTMDQNGEKRTVKWPDLVVLHVDEPPLPPADSIETEIETIGGSRLVTTGWSSDGVQFTVKTRSGVALEIPASTVLVVRSTGGRFVYASDLAWTSTYAFTYPDEDPEDARSHKRWWGARADKTPDGAPLVIANTRFRHGIAAHAKSAVSVPLGKRFSKFETKFGIDDSWKKDYAGGSKGDVTARIVADGREVWTSGGSVKGGDAARTIGPIDVAGVETLVLEVDFGADGDVNDNAVWVDPLLVKAK
jgi:hypothetical protein